MEDTRLLCRALFAGVCALAISAPAFAQTAPGAAGNDAIDANTIIVTAQNRAESVQNVPITMDVLGGAELEKAGITDMRELERLAPAVQITSDTGLTYVTIRGVGTQSNNETQDTSVTVNIDGEYLNRPNVMNASIFDLDRVEALRGPQGTLYGRNATAGALNFITRKPGFDFGANGSISYGNYQQVTATGGVDIPFSDNAAVRIAGIWSNRDKGYFYHPNIASGSVAAALAGRPYLPLAILKNRSGTQDTKGGRISFRFEPTSGLRIDLAGEYVSIDAIQGQQAFINLNSPGFAPTAGCGNGYVDVAPLAPGDQCVPLNTQFQRGIDRKSFNAPITGLGNIDLDSYAIRGKIAYDFGPATITYIGGYRHTDGEESPSLSPGYRFLNFGNRIETQSHELRLNGGGGRLQWQGGVFYFHENQLNERGLYNPFIGPQGSYITYFRRPEIVSKSYSVFGQVDYELTSHLTAQAGIRYTESKRHALFQNYNFVFNAGPVPQTVTPAETLNLSADEDNISWLAGLNYKPDGDTLIYAKVSTGFKGGGFDAVGNYGPEKNTAYETGLKKTFGASRQHLFNIAAFYYDYKGLQNSVILDNTKGGQIFNAGGATIWGVEADWKIQLSPKDRFTGSFNYLNAEFDDLLAAYPLVTDLDPVTPGVQQPNLAGNTPPQSPKFTITLGYDHIFDMGSAGTVTASLFSRFKSDYFMTIFNERDLQQKAFTQTDFSLEYRPEHKRLGIQAYVQNIENTRAMVGGNYTAAGPDRVLNFSFSNPRLYGVRLSFSY